MTFFASAGASGLGVALAMALFGVGHPKLCDSGNAVLVLSPEHWAIFRDAGWDRRRLEEALYRALKRPGRDLVLKGLKAIVAEHG